MPVLLLVVAFCIAYFLYKSKNPLKRGVAVQPTFAPYVLAAPDAAPACHWGDGGRYGVEVVVESAFQGAIRELAGAHGDSAAAVKTVAVLLPDDLNPYDGKAVAVFVEGRMVGYLALEDALDMRGKLGRKGLPGAPSSCDAMLRGGGLWQGKRLAYNVVLDIPPVD